MSCVSLFLFHRNLKIFHTRFFTHTLVTFILLLPSSSSDQGAWIATTSAVETVLADPSIDVVDVCLPPFLHLPVSVQALEAGKHVHGEVCRVPRAERHGGFGRQPWKGTGEAKTVVWDQLLGKVELKDDDTLTSDSLQWLLKLVTHE